MKPRLTIALRISLSIGSVIIIVMAGIFFIVSGRVRSTINNLIAENSFNQLEARGDQIDGTITSFHQLLATVSMRDVFFDGTPAEIEEAAYALIQSKALGEQASNVLIIWPDGRASATPGNYVDIHDRPYVKAIFQDHQPASMSAPLVSRYTKKPAVMLVHAFKDRAGNVRGALAVEMGMSNIDEMMNEITIGASSRALLVDEAGLVFSASEADLVMKLNVLTADQDAGYRGLSGAAEKAMAESPTESTFVGPNGLDCLVFTTRVSDALPWQLFCIAETKSLMAPLTQLDFILVAIMLAGVIVANVAAILVGRMISSPIKKVALTLKDISEGEGDLTMRVDAKRKDEIGDLSRYFNETLDKIKDLVLVIREQSAQLSDIGGDLSSNMTETAAAINQITANIQSIKERVASQHDSVTSTNQTMTRVTENIGELNVHVEKQTSQVSQSSAAIEEMLANIQSVTATLEKNSRSVQKLKETSEVGRSGLSEVSIDIQEISKESEGLLEINAVMENIASQTNLLSMNAAIEAAHAGEAGKGFAVVADEIRKLAENSGEQSKTISTVLKKIKESIDKIMGSTQNVIQEFDAIETMVNTVTEQTDNIRNAMEEQNAGSKQILDVIGELNTITKDVKSGSEQMRDGSKQVIEESENLGSISEEISQGMVEMATGADQINAAVVKVQEITQLNKKDIDILVTAVSRFKVN